jgi:cobalamin-dependent methionine synthase I
VLDDDHVAAFVTTAGKGVMERARELKEQGEYLKSHVLQALALETAEAAAELIHHRLRELWGFPDRKIRRWKTASRRATAASATASATRPAPIWRTRSSSSRRWPRKTSASP